MIKLKLAVKCINNNIVLSYTTYFEAILDKIFFLPAVLNDCAQYFINLMIRFQLNNLSPHKMPALLFIWMRFVSMAIHSIKIELQFWGISNLFIFFFAYCETEFSADWPQLLPQKSAGLSQKSAGLPQKFAGLSLLSQYCTGYFCISQILLTSKYWVRNLLIRALLRNVLTHEASLTHLGCCPSNLLRLILHSLQRTLQLYFSMLPSQLLLFTILKVLQSILITWILKSSQLLLFTILIVLQPIFIIWILKPFFFFLTIIISFL